MDGCLLKVQKPLYYAGKYLVEYYLYDVHKLGYLVVSPIEGFVLVRSFLFLTMDGTPEGRRVRKHMSEAKIKQLRLDTRARL